MNTIELLYIDLFCGAGGTSSGVEYATVDGRKCAEVIACVNHDVVCGIYCIVGYVCALLFMPSLKVAMFIWGLCCGIDNIGWLVVYHRNREKFLEIKQD